MNYSVDVPREFRPLVSPELRPDERVVWIGQPTPWRFVKRFIAVFFFGVFWSGFLVFWADGFLETGIRGQDGWLGLAGWAAFSIPFFLIGIGMLSTPYWSWRKAKRTVYVLTNERAILFDASWWRAMTIRSFEPARLTDLRRIQLPDGSGDLVFERTVTTDSEGSTKTTDHGFLSIPNVKSIEEAVQQLVQRMADAAKSK
jgi:hypothetical protein